MTAVDSTRTSLRKVLARPVLIVAELTWRWAFSLGAIGVVLIYAQTLRDAISLSATDQAAFVSGNIVSMVSAGTAILAGAWPYLAQAFLGAAPKIALIWWVCATVGRIPVLRGALETAGKPSGLTAWRMLPGMAVVHAIRVILLLIIVIGFVGGSRVSALVIGRPDDPNIFLSVITFTFVLAVSAMLWSVTNLVASNAAYFVADSERSGLEATAKALQFTLREKKKIGELAGWNALFRTVAATVVTMAGLLLVPFAKVAPTGLLLGLLAILTVIYCVASDVFLLARTVSYMALAFSPELEHSQAAAPESALYTPTPDLRK